MQHNFYSAGISAAKTLKSYIKQGCSYIYKAGHWFMKTFF